MYSASTKPAEMLVTEKLLKSACPATGITCTVPVSAACAAGQLAASPGARGASHRRRSMGIA